MKKDDFKVGQEVCLLFFDYRCDHYEDYEPDKDIPFNERLMVGTVTNIGRKYITVRKDCSDELLQFDMDRNFIHNQKAMVINHIYQPFYELYLSKEDAVRVNDTREKAKFVYNLIVNKYSRPLFKLSDKDLDIILDIIDK